MSEIPDVDIEVADRDNVAKLFPSAVVASQIAREHLVRHTSGLYFQDIPRHPISDLAVFPYEESERLGFYKIDLLSCPNPYDGITSMDELRELLACPIDWSWFTDAVFVSTLFHMNGEVHLPGGASDKLLMGEVVAYYKPQSIMDLAVLIAIKLPAKKHLIGEPWAILRKEIWKKRDGIHFKRAHATAYSFVVGIDARKKSPQFFDLPIPEDSCLLRILAKDQVGG